MYLDKNTFERSFFYIGPGYDIQPLLRFTHLCDTFIYPNVYLNRRPVEEWYDSAFEHAKDIEVLDKRVTRGFDAEIAMECGTDRHASIRDVFKMGHYEYMDFFLKLRNARDLERYSITWRLRRRSTGRVLTLHFFTCEGLEAYAILSQIGRYAPRILCTIETRMFESPRGVIDRFFVDQQRARPILWVRGFAPDLHFPSRHSLNDRRRDAFDSVGVFSVRAMSFNHQWLVGRSFERQRTSERHCFGFMTKEFTRELHEKSWNPEFEDERHKFVTESIANGIARMGNKDVAFLSRRLINRFSLDRNHVHSWESILGECGHKQTAAVQIETLRGFVDRLDPPSDAQIHLVQNCLEDENASYLAALRALRHRTVTYCRDLADLLELKKVALDFSNHESPFPGGKVSVPAASTN
jgi:hypothetical protein